MCGIGGAWLSAGPQQMTRTLQQLGQGLEARGPDGGDSLRLGTVGLVHRAFRVTPSSRRERQPARGAGGACLVWDGRLDNRDDLDRQLAGGDRRADVAYVLAAFERWGTGAFERLVGDFALALWDPARERLLLARDPMGTRPLFYHRGRAGLLFSSSLDALVDGLGLSDEIDRQWLVDFLCDSVDSRTTPYRGIHAVAPGTFLEVTDGGARRRRFWSLEPRETIRYRHDEEYEQHYRRLFLQAVRRRLRAQGPVGAELSGGVDSSSIVCAAHQLLRSGDCETAAILPVSVVYRDSKTADERRFIAEIERSIGAASHHVVQEDHPILDPTDEPLYEIPSPVFSVQARERAITAYLRSQGARSLLSGFGGDQVLWSENDVALELADFLLQGRLADLARSLKRWNEALGQPYWQLLLGSGVYPLLPAAIRSRWGLQRVRLPDFFHPELVRRARLRQRFFWEQRLDRRPALPTLRQRLFEIRDAIEVVCLEYERGPDALEVSYPYLDRDLVELCLALPYRQLVRGGETRSVHRRALRDLVPATVLWRRTKTSMEEAILRALREQWPKLAPKLCNLRLAELGIIEPGRFRDQLQRARFGASPGIMSWLAVLAVELWLRRRERRPTASGPL